MNLESIPAFAEGNLFHVVVESPKGSTLKLKYELQWVALTVSRPHAVNADLSRRIRNDRILALPTEARREQEWTSLNDLSPRTRREYEVFTQAAAALEGKDVTVLGWGEPAEALALLRASVVPVR